MHQPGIEAARAGYQVRVGAHRIPNAPTGVFEVRRHATAANQTCEAGGETPERHGEGRHATAITTEQDFICFQAANFGHGLQYPALHRVVRLAIVSEAPAFVGAQGEHAGVFTGAVAVDGRWRLTAAGQTGGGWPVKRRVRTVLQVVLEEAGLLQYGAYRREVPVLAAVRGAGDRYLFVGKPEVVGRAGEKQGDSLERFGRRPYVNVAFRVADRIEDCTVGVADDGAAPVDALDQGSAPGRGKGGVVWKRGVEVGLQVYPPEIRITCKPIRSWATRIRAMAGGNSPFS